LGVEGAIVSEMKSRVPNATVEITRGCQLALQKGEYVQDLEKVHGGAIKSYETDFASLDC
jgi:hypothetical protein